MQHRGGDIGDHETWAVNATSARSTTRPSSPTTLRVPVTARRP